jgi:hypothetical protein
MPILPGDSPKKTPQNLNEGSKDKRKNLGTFVRSGDGLGGKSVGRSAKSGYKVLKSAKSGSFVTGGSGKKNPTSTVKDVVQVEMVVPGIVGRVTRALRNQLAHGIKLQEASPITVRVYLDTDDAVTSLRVVKALGEVLESAGYGKTKIEGVEKGSVRLRLKAWLDGPDGQAAQQGAKNKLGEAASYAEQWAKDATVNKQRAEISSINAKTNQTLMESVKDVDNAALQMDEWLIVKFTDAQGNVNVLTRKLSVTEMMLVDRNPAILNKPSEVLDKLTLLAYEHTNSQMAIEG